jgi:hypothetical protein
MNRTEETCDYAVCRICQKIEYNIVAYVNCLISNIAANGAAFFVKHMPNKNTVLSKTSAPKPAKDEMYRNVYKCIFCQIYTCITV